MPAWSVIVLIVCNLAWALNVVVGKVAVDDLAIPPIFFAGLRSAIVVVALLPLLLRAVPARLAAVLAVGLARAPLPRLTCCKSPLGELDDPAEPAPPPTLPPPPPPTRPTTPTEPTPFERRCSRVSSGKARYSS